MDSGAPRRPLLARLIRMVIPLRIVALNGSPRKGGNTDALIDEFLRGAREAGAECEKIYLEDYTINPAGELGDVRSRRGGGTILIREAQMLKVPLMLAILQVVHLAIDDDNAFHDAMFDFIVDGDELILERIDLRGKALSMVGAGTVQISAQLLDLVLLVGSPLQLPRLEILSEFMESMAGQPQLLLE